MTPAQLARRLDGLADKLAPRRLSAMVHHAQGGQPAPAITLGTAVAALLHTVSRDVRARAAQEHAGSAGTTP